MTIFILTIVYKVQTFTTHESVGLSQGRKNNLFNCKHIMLIETGTDDNFYFNNSL